MSGRSQGNSMKFFKGILEYVSGIVGMFVIIPLLIYGFGWIWEHVPLIQWGWNLYMALVVIAVVIAILTKTFRKIRGREARVSRDDIDGDF